MDQPLFRRADGALGDPTGLATGLDSGDTAFIIICGALVMMMTLPGLVLFYSNLSLSLPFSLTTPFWRGAGCAGRPRRCVCTHVRRPRRARLAALRRAKDPRRERWSVAGNPRLAIYGIVPGTPCLRKVRKAP